MSNYVLPATIAKRFGMSTDALLWSRKRGLHPGKAGYTVKVDGERKLVFPADLQPEDPQPEVETTVSDNPQVELEADPQEEA